MIEHLLSKVRHIRAHVQRQLLYICHKPAWQIYDWPSMLPRCKPFQPEGGTKAQFLTGTNHAIKLLEGGCQLAWRKVMHTKDLHLVASPFFCSHLAAGKHRDTLLQQMSKQKDTGWTFTTLQVFQRRNRRPTVTCTWSMQSCMWQGARNCN